MALNIDEILTPQSEEEILETLLSIIETIGLPARSWRKGGMARVILRAFASQLSGLSVLVTDVAKSGFLDTAQGDWLTLLAYYGYGVERREATYATGKVRLTNTSGGTFTRNADEVLVLNPSSNKTYSIAEGFSLTSLGQTVVVDVRATEIGADSNAITGAISELVTQLPGLTVTNEAPVVGSNAWTDDELRAVCRAKLSAISVRGPRGAYEYAVLTALRNDGSAVNINRHSVSPSSSQGIVTVYVASPSGTPITEDIDAVVANVERHARPDSVKCFVLPATEKVITRSLTVWADPTAGIDAPMLKLIVEQKLAEKIAQYRIGGRKKLTDQGYLFMDYLDGVVTSAHPSIWEVDGLLDDVALLPSEVAVLVPTVTVRITQQDG